MPPKIGPKNHAEIISERMVKSVFLPAKKFHPIIAPTMAWEVDTGIDSLTIQAVVMAAERAIIKAPAKDVMSPNESNVLVAPEPSITAPRMTQTEDMMAAVRNFIILVATAVPKLEASLAPNDHPKNSPELK